MEAHPEIQKVLDRLLAEGYENCRLDDYWQIIVNNRGEIEFCDRTGIPEWQIYSRVPNLGWVEPATTIDSLFDQIKRIWTKQEPK